MPLMPTPVIRPKGKIGANEPCWCGSGKKFKKCHRDKERQPVVNPHEFAKEAISEFNRKYCSHPQASSGGCNHIIKSHTITKGMALKAIAEDGHVYTGKSSFQDFNKNNGRIVPKKVGVNLASTFLGFCGKHDNELFEPIEQGEICLDSEGIFLLSYRTMAFEMYQKEAELHAIKVCRDTLDKGRSRERQVSLQSEMNVRIRYTEMGVREASVSKGKYDQMLTSGTFSDLKYVAVRIDQPLPIVSSGGRFPDFDFERNALFDISDAYDDPPIVMMNIVSDRAGTIASLAWLRDDPRLISFADNFLKMIDERGVDFLVHLGIATCDNTYYRPSWWEGLDKVTQDALCDAAISDVSPGVPRWHEAIANPISFGLPGQVTKTVKQY